MRRAWTSSTGRARGEETSVGGRGRTATKAMAAGSPVTSHGRRHTAAASRTKVTVVGGRAERETGSRGSRPGPGRDRRERGPPSASVDPGAEAEAGGRAVQSGSHERPERRPLRSAGQGPRAGRSCPSSRGYFNPRSIVGSVFYNRKRHPSQLVSLSQPTMNSSGSPLRHFAHGSAFSSNRLLAVALIIWIYFNYKLGEALGQTELLGKLVDRPPPIARENDEVEIFPSSWKHLSNPGNFIEGAPQSYLSSASTSRSHPRRVTLEPLIGRKRIRFEMDSTPPDAPIPTQRWHDLNALDYLDGYVEGHEDECEPMYEWQLEGYPSCNAFHEINMKELRLINSGGSRTAFELKVPLKGREGKYVFKTIKWKIADRISPKLADEQRKDSLVMMKTDNDFIPPVWGYCSTAVLMDFMPEGSMHDYSE